MDTKLKRYSIWLKLAVFILAVAAMTGMAFAGLQLLRMEFQGEFHLFDMFTQEYLDTEYFYHDKLFAQNTLYRLTLLRSEDHINSGALVTEERIQSQIDSLLAPEHETLVNRFYKEHGYNAVYSELKEIFVLEHEDEIAEIPQQLIDEDLAEFRQLRQQLDSRPEIYYYAVAGSNYIFNMTENNISNQRYVYDGLTETSYVAFKTSYITSKSAEFHTFGNTARMWLAATIVAFICSVLCLIYLIYATGRKTSEPTVHHSVIDKLYSEFSFAVMVLAALGLIVVFDQLVRTTFYYKFAFNTDYAVVAFFAAICIVGLSMFLSLARRVKSKTVLTHSLTFFLLRNTFFLLRKLFRYLCQRLSKVDIFSQIFNFSRRIWNSGSLMRKTAAAIAGAGLLLMIPFVGAFLGVIILPLAVYIASTKVKMFNTILDGVSAVKNGYSTPITTESKGEFKLLADSINELSAGLNDEVERRLKAERLKTELISNVSHDIRTPLTSVITYIDLLKSEKTDNDNIKKYVDVIDQKADRLRILMDDLFEASKAASGNIPVTFEKVDVSSLITQGLGELNDKIKASTLDFRVSMPNEKLYVKADGRQLWRVVENLLSNVLKYSLENSRVYIEAFENYDMVTIEIKNISAIELNVHESELMERFKRGDESRSTPGSGLGLAIARSLMLAQNGSLEIKIDGDLFKAVITIPKYYKSPQHPQSLPSPS